MEKEQREKENEKRKAPENNVFIRKIQNQNQSKQSSTCFCSCSLVVTGSNDVADLKPEKEQRRRQKKHICISKMIINPKKSRKENGLFWVGQEGGFRLHLNNCCLLPTGFPEYNYNTHAYYTITPDKGILKISDIGGGQLKADITAFVKRTIKSKIDGQEGMFTVQPENITIAFD